MTRLDETHVIMGQYMGQLTIFEITINTIEQKCQIQLETHNSIYCIYKVSETQILVGGDELGVKMINISLKDNYEMTEDDSFHLLPKETIESMLPLQNERYLCAVHSGSLQMMDFKASTASLYATKYGGKIVQCIVPFPGFDERLFPLVLIKEWEVVVIFNTELKHYVKVTYANNENEWKFVSNQRLCFLDKENEEYCFIT